MSGTLVLFTRDLRVRDNAALASAAREGGALLPAFVLDRRILAHGAGTPNRLAFLLDSLRDLDASLRERGARLVVRSGDVVEEAMRLVHEHGLSAIHMSEDITPYARERQRRLRDACATARVALHTHGGVTALAAGAIAPSGGGHYRVFTPYWRVWRELVDAPVVAAPRRLALPRAVRAGSIPALGELTAGAPSPTLDVGGESAARERLKRWRHARAARYDELHDDLPGDGTSRLSAYLHFGCLSARTLLASAASAGDGAADSEGFARQLCWRDFHHQVLADRPDMVHADYRPRERPWRKDERAARAWRAGRTGYPIVDAGMRQLIAEGYMHNRARLIVASFLTKTLRLDWRIGAARFAELLADADVANNVGNWQWVAGTGNDTRPNRVLNPIRQAHRFDPDGEYVRRYVPELAGVSARAVHEPWRLGAARRALHYPERIVDHDVAAAAFRERG